MRGYRGSLAVCLMVFACAGERAPSPARHASALMTTTPLVALGAQWKFRDDGMDLGTAWRAPAFDDASWKQGPARLGYGDQKEATVISFGPDPKNKHVTTYFRHTFEVDDPTRFAGLILRILADDGAVVYLNGVEVMRENLPVTPINASTFAIKNSVEDLFVLRALPPRHLVVGTNVLAIEVHQVTRDSTDMAFDLELVGSEDLFLVRGPYLQMGSPRRVVVRWRTDLPSDSRVRYGTAAARLDQMVDDPRPKTEHTVALPRLLPATKYYYAIGNKEGNLVGADEEHYFVTPPTAGTDRPTRIWVLGDAGRADDNVRNVRDAYARFSGGKIPDVWLMLGDNAYDEGTDDQYQKAVFEMYPKLLPKVFLWPTIGNHETAAFVSGEAEAYLGAFDLPARAEAGGMASGTEKYYSFDWANIHFVCLDSMSSMRTPGAPMLTWLEADLRANTRAWLIAYWHHPPYSKGNHDSDAEGELIEMRQFVVPILEKYGVDMVLAGHSHVYERSYLLDRHYGPSDTLEPHMIKNAGSGRLAEGGAYTKASTGPGPNEGAVYVVAGSGAHNAPGYALDHPAMYIAFNELGSLSLDINGLELKADFVRDTGEVPDTFVIKKGVGTPAAAPGAPTGLQVMAASATSVRLVWRDGSHDESGFEVERSEDGMKFAKVVTVGANATMYLHRPVSAGTVHHYRVRAVNAAGASAWSNAAMARTRDCDPPGPCRDAGTDATAAVAMTPDAGVADGPAVIPPEPEVRSGACSLGGREPSSALLALVVVALVLVPRLRPRPPRPRVRACARCSLACPPRAASTRRATRRTCASPEVP